MTQPTKGRARPERSLPSSEAKGRRGPSTAAGRAAVRHNALKHGLASPHPVIIEELETEEAWQRHLDGIVAYLAPEGALEEAFADRVALCLWRLRRTTHYETAMLNYQVQTTENDLAIAEAYRAGTLSDGELPAIEPHRVAGFRQTRLVPADTALDRILRYETHLHRLLLQTLHELEALQARRRGEPTHLTRFDISAPPPCLPRPGSRISPAWPASEMNKPVAPMPAAVRAYCKCALGSVPTRLTRGHAPASDGLLPGARHRHKAAGFIPQCLVQPSSDDGPSHRRQPIRFSAPSSVASDKCLADLPEAARGVVVLGGRRRLPAGTLRGLQRRRLRCNLAADRRWQETGLRSSIAKLAGPDAAEACMLTCGRLRRRTHRLPRPARHCSATGRSASAGDLRHAARPAHTKPAT